MCLVATTARLINARCGKEATTLLSGVRGQRELPWTRFARRQSFPGGIIAIGLGVLSEKACVFP